jgi:hypothetical protein
MADRLINDENQYRVLEQTVDQIKHKDDPTPAQKTLGEIPKEATWAIIIVASIFFLGATSGTFKFSSGFTYLVFIVIGVWVYTRLKYDDGFDTYHDAIDCEYAIRDYVNKKRRLFGAFKGVTQIEVMEDNREVERLSQYGNVPIARVFFIKTYIQGQNPEYYEASIDPKTLDIKFFIKNDQATYDPWNEKYKSIKVVAPKEYEEQARINQEYGVGK